MKSEELRDSSSKVDEKDAECKKERRQRRKEEQQEKRMQKLRDQYETIKNTQCRDVDSANLQFYKENAKKIDESTFFEIEKGSKNVGARMLTGRSVANVVRC